MVLNLVDGNCNEKETFTGLKMNCPRQKTTKISIPDHDTLLPQVKPEYEDTKHLKKPLRSINRIINPSNGSELKCLSGVPLMKALGFLLLVCDILYLNLNLRKTETALLMSSKKIERLETEINYNKLSCNILRSDLNCIKNMNKRLTNDIISTVTQLIKLNKDYMNHMSFPDNSFTDNLVVKRNDNIIMRVVKEVQSYDFDNLFQSENEKLDYSEEDFENLGKNNSDTADAVNKSKNDSWEVAKVYNDTEESLKFEREQIDSMVNLMNETIQSLSAIRKDHHLRARREAHSERRGPLVVSLRGIQPEAVIQDGGIIAPWFVESNGPGDYPFRDYILREGNGKLELTEKGLFLIYAQVYYLSMNQLNGFSIALQKMGDENEYEIAKCSVDISVKRTSEVSCYTSVARQLVPGDKIFLVQREKSSRILHGEGHTYLGLVALNSPPKC